MNLNEAVTMGRQVLDQERDSAATWQDRRMLLRTALQMVLDAIEDNTGSEEEDDEEPVPHQFPAAYHAPWEEIKPGQCYGCHGNAEHDGTWHEAVPA